jgi:hypothetical protein
LTQGSEPLQQSSQQQQQQQQATPTKPRKPSAAVAEYEASGLVAGGTLVVCPTSVLHQWAKEVADKVHPLAGCSLHVYHGKVRGACQTRRVFTC